MGGTEVSCVLCQTSGHETKNCPNLQTARAAIKCDLCTTNGHITENCPNLAAAQAAVKAKTAPQPKPEIQPPENIARVSDNGPILYFDNGARVCDHGSFVIRRSPNAPNRFLGVFAQGTETKEVKLWSGQPGIISSSPLTFENSVSFRITYGTGMIARAGGPGNYQIIPDHRGQIIRVTETDSNAECTDVYIDVNAATATIGLGWITDFIPFQ